MLTREELDRRFAHHAPSNDGVASRHGVVRSTIKSATEAVLQNIPPDCREASVFLTKMEEAMFWANAAIARNQ